MRINKSFTMMRQRGGKGDLDDAGIQVEAKEGSLAQSVRKVLKKVDVYPKMHKEFRVQTESGATVSVVAGVIMLLLFLSELHDYMRVRTHEHMVVDSTINDKLRINLDVSFFAINCKDAHLNAMDVAGDLQMNMHHTVQKFRLDPEGNEIGKPISMTDTEVKTEVPSDYCGSCYNAKHPSGKTCCNTCDEVKEAFIANDISLEDAEQKEQCLRDSVAEEQQAKEGEGCRIKGWMNVNRVAGNFHVALGRTFHREGRLVHQFRPGQEFTFNASHAINSLSFGASHPGADNSHPLDGTVKIADKIGAVFQYYLKIVPTIYSDVSSSEPSYQFSYTQQARHLNPYGQMSALPGTFFVFDLSPFMVKVDYDRVPLTHFLTKICAIIGGMIAIAGFVDTFLHNYVNVSKSTTKYG